MRNATKSVVEIEVEGREGRGMFVKEEKLLV